MEFTLVLALLYRIYLGSGAVIYDLSLPVLIWGMYKTSTRQVQDKYKTTVQDKYKTTGFLV